MITSAIVLPHVGCLISSVEATAYCVGKSVDNSILSDYLLRATCNGRCPRLGTDRSD